jgi:hypothetical protein
MSATAVRGGEYARSALGPLGARLSGLLYCPCSPFLLPPPFSPFFPKTDLYEPAAYQQPVKYNLAVAHEVLKHVYADERLQPPTSLGAVLGTYGTL